MPGLVLSLFPGIGLLDMAFELEGFCVVRGPDLLWGGDIRRFHPPIFKFDGIIGGPPCQAFSRLRHLVEHNGYKVAENLIPEFERCIDEAKPEWFLMENVPAAPLPHVFGYSVTDRLVSNRDHCGGEAARVRRFSFGQWGPIEPRFDLEWWSPSVPMKYEPAVLASGGERMTPVKIGGSGKSKAAVLGNKTRSYAAAAAAQGVPGLELPAFTTAAKIKAIGNGVPLSMGVAIARAVKRTLNIEQEGEASMNRGAIRTASRRKPMQATILEDRLAKLDELMLLKGAHKAGHGMCAMEAAAWLAGEKHSDAPSCVSPILRTFMIRWNDDLDDEGRQKLKPFLPRIIGTAGDGKDELRGWLAADWLVRVHTPAWLELGGVKESAAALRALPPLRSLATLTAAQSTIEEAKTKAAAARDAARAAARAAARDAAWAAALDAARAAALDAARAAARDAAGDAAWAAARDAAWDAAWAAARDAACKKLEPTKIALQASALELLDAMIDPKE